LCCCTHLPLPEDLGHCSHHLRHPVVELGSGASNVKHQNKH
jgi:hypothetical protein